MSEPAAAPEAIVRRVETATHGRILLAVPAGGGPFPLVAGFHGYGENAAKSLAALRALPGADRWALCAVQGLHRFYERKSGEVVAGWMTSEDRELAIADNVAYVRRALVPLLAEEWSNGRLAYVGFSQGVAMAYRAAAFAGLAASGLVALAGDVPPDVLAAGMRGFPPVLLGTGRADGWYTPGRLAEDEDRLRALGVATESLVFEGGHVWTSEFQRAAGAFLARILAPV